MGKRIESPFILWSSCHPKHHVADDPRATSFPIQLHDWIQFTRSKLWIHSQLHRAEGSNKLEKGWCVCVFFHDMIKVGDWERHMSLTDGRKPSPRSGKPRYAFWFSYLNCYVVGFSSTASENDLTRISPNQRCYLLQVKTRSRNKEHQFPQQEWGCGDN